MSSIKVIVKFLLHGHGNDLIYLVPYRIIDTISLSIVFGDNLTLSRARVTREKNNDIVYISIG